jgi:hypothetical protein
MSASQQCSRSCREIRRYLVAFALVLCSVSASGAEPRPTAESDCDPEGVIAHVREQFRIYGPKSRRHEYFGFVYRVDGELASAVIRSYRCRGPYSCLVDTAPAARRIPQRAKVLGEWHTHPHILGSGTLSIEDVQGARNNAHIRCYSAFYATSSGKIHAWDPRSTSVPTAMGTRTLLGSYRLDERAAPVAYLAKRAAPEDDEEEQEHEDEEPD